MGSNLCMAGFFCNTEVTKDHQISVSQMETGTTFRSNDYNTKREPRIACLFIRLSGQDHTGNLKNLLGIANGTIVSTTFRFDGVFENHVDES